MKIPLLILTLISLPAPAQTAPSSEKKTSDFVRVHYRENQVFLQTAIVTFKKSDIQVTLFGAIHLADKSYFNTLNTRFKAYDRLLFEMIGGDEITKTRKIKVPKTPPASSPLAEAYQLISSFLKLADQKEQINYLAENFIHADLSLSEYQKLQAKRGESLHSFALTASQKTQPRDEPSPLPLITALANGDSNQAKLLLVETLAHGDEAIAKIVTPTVIITDRNAKALQVLKSEIQNGHKKLGIFYGAAHLPNLEKELLEQGYKKTKQEWLTAWSLEK